MQHVLAGRADLRTPKSTGHLPKLTRQVLQDLQEAVSQNPTVTVQQLSRHFDLGLATVHRALQQKLKLKKRPAIWRPHDLSAAQRLRRVTTARQLLGRMRQSPNWSSKVFTVNETWMFAYCSVLNCVLPANRYIVIRARIVLILDSPAVTHL